MDSVPQTIHTRKFWASLCLLTRKNLWSLFSP